MREGVLAWPGHLGKLSHQTSSVSTSRNIYFQVTERCAGPIASSLDSSCVSKSLLPGVLWHKDLFIGAFSVFYEGVFLFFFFSNR